ncbi:unnamed protein product [Rotaria magnacalcarata]|uniref:Uncharacterized protein n=1 Tax=Rotaria magnacalcarata TaxID=392030 RepID=A0A819XI07_9BILA|nr:unnamed protein product [Rotaria magnacalcarata]CAF4141796.1 unnamed protein product [Rotaria magnacalcarata]
MPCRSQKVQSNKKKTNSSSTIGIEPSIQLNTNACNQEENNIISHLESIGNSIINKLTGTERDRLKQQLLISYASHTNSIHGLSLSSSKTSFKQVLNDLHTFDCHTQQQYCTVGTDDHDTSVKNAITTNDNPLDVIIKQQINNTNILNDQFPSSTAIKHHKKKQTTSPIIENENKSTPNIITRTICTRSSKLNNLNNNEEQPNPVILTRTRKRRSSVTNNMGTSAPVNHIDDAKEEDHLAAQKTSGNDVCGTRVSRRKLQSSVPSIECSKPTNEF